MTDPATQPEAPAEPQQPATGPHSDAHGQREQLRERIRNTLHDIDCGDPTCEAPTMSWYHRQADAVMLLIDEWEHKLTLDLTAVCFDRDVCRDIAEREHDRADHAETMANDLEAENARLKNRAEAGLTESSWPDGGPDDEIGQLRRENAGLYGSLDGARQRVEAAEQERDTLRAHVDADHQVLAQVRHHVDRLRDWCRDPEATVTIAGSICADLQKTLDGDVDE